MIEGEKDTSTAVPIDSYSKAKKTTVTALSVAGKL
jgi:hypothetical protein